MYYARTVLVFSRRAITLEEVEESEEEEDELCVMQSEQSPRAKDM
eukprot:jgi/Antlo1/1038/417